MNLLATQLPRFSGPIFGLFVFLTLPACQTTAVSTQVSLSRQPATLLDGAIRVAGPHGYCVDPAATRELGDTAVVLLGRCKDALGVTPALLTVAVGPTASSGVLAAGGAALTTYFTSSEGRATLSRMGRAGDVAVVEAVGVGDAYLLHLQDRAAGDYWRAVVGLNGRLVTISANGAQGTPLAQSEGRILVDSTLAALRRTN